MLLLLILLTFIGLSVWMAWYFISHDRGEKEPIGMLWIALGMGLVGAIMAVFLESFFIDEKMLRPGSALGPLFIGTLMVGIFEEGCKFIPLYFILFKKRYFNEHTDGLIYFALAGIGFGLPENILYTLKLGSSAGLARIILTPFFHAATTALVGYFLIKGKIAHKSQLGAFVALLSMMLLHGLYDFGLFSQRLPLALMSLVITVSISTSLFVLYSRATHHDRRLGLSAIGNNRFCRSCGAPNVKRNLYCANCGKYA